MSNYLAPIETVRADIRELVRLIEPGSVAVVACMGDTLPHLDARADVSRLFADAHAALEQGGLLILTFRDLSTELVGLDRFIPVHADADRIMTCVLEYETDTVVVNDLIHVRQGDGWDLRKSRYRKLRLSPGALAEELRHVGFKVLRNEAAGRLQAIVAEKCG